MPRKPEPDLAAVSNASGALCRLYSARGRIEAEIEHQPKQPDGMTPAQIARAGDLELAHTHICEAIDCMNRVFDQAQGRAARS